MMRKTCIVNVRLTKVEKECLQKKADLDMRSVSNYANKVIKELLERIEVDPMIEKQILGISIKKGKEERLPIRFDEGLYNQLASISTIQNQKIKLTSYVHHLLLFSLIDEDKS